MTVTRDEVLEELEAELDEKRVNGILTQLQIKYDAKGAIA